MNFLTHLYFCNKSRENTTGLIIGNTARPNYLSKYNLEILKGIAMDMQIRRFSEGNADFNNSIQKINTKYSKNASFMVNIFYDHFLAKNWDKYAKIPLDGFSDTIYQIILENMNLLPYKVRKFSPEMISKEWITGLTSIEGTHRYIKLISKTERFTTNLDQCLIELIENYQQYNNDFENYFKSLCKFMEEEDKKVRLNENQRFLLSA